MKTNSTVGEIADRVVADAKDIAAMCRIEDGAIAFRESPESGHSFYRIALSECGDYQHILWRVGDLMEKSWITIPLLEQFIHHACSHHSLRPR